jgi:hypothetical protein
MADAKLELLRRIYCLGIQDIRNAFGDHKHILDKYEACRKNCEGGYGNYKFIFDLDEDYAKMLFKSIGYNGVDLGEKIGR